MARANPDPTTADETETADETTVINVRHSDFTPFDKGETVRVHYRDEPAEPSKTIEGALQLRYTDEKALIETDDGREIIVDLSDVGADGSVYEFGGGDLGWAMFVETAYTVNKSEEQLREELLDDDSDDDGVDRGDGIETDGGRDVSDDGLACPCCGETDELKEGAALPDGRTFDYGCRSCMAPFDADDAARPCTIDSCDELADYEYQHEQGAVTWTVYYCETHGRGFGRDNDRLTPLDDAELATDGGQPAPSASERCGVDVVDVPTSPRRRNPVDECDHELVTSDYLERPDGQHEVMVCESCDVVLADHGAVEPSNVVDE